MPGKRRGPAIFIVLLATIAVLIFLIGSIIPPIVRETSSFVSNFPQTLSDSFYKNDKLQNFISQYELQDDIDSAVQSGKKRIIGYSDDAIASAGQVGSGLLTGVTILVISVLMLTGGSRILHRFADLAYRDQSLRVRHEAVANKMYRAVTGYVIGQVSVALVASLFALSALFLLNVPYQLPLASIVFALGLIPLIGNTLAAVLVVLSTLILKDVPAALILLAFFVVYQQIENITLQPIIQGKTTNLPPLVIFVSVILGVALIGPIGGLLAIPAAGVVKVLLLDYFNNRPEVDTMDSPKTLVEKVKHKVTEKLPKTI